MISVGTDIVSVSRVKKIKHLEKFFHKSELKNPNKEHLAGIIAAKEAFFKALGKIPNWNEIEVKHAKSGQPYFEMQGNYKSLIKSHSCSISHDGDFAIAVVILNLDDGD